MRDLALVNIQFEPFDDDSSSLKSGRAANNATPWEDFDMPGTGQPAIKANSDVDKLYPLPVTEISASEAGSYASSSTASEEMSVTVPPGFNMTVFDRAYDIVKRDIFFNTWMKYEASVDESTAPVSQPKPRPTHVVVPTSWLPKKVRAKGRGDAK